jgi:hypothetical protein
MLVAKEHRGLVEAEGAINLSENPVNFSQFRSFQFRFITDFMSRYTCRSRKNETSEKIVIKARINFF